MIRKAELKDAPEIARVLTETWKTAYRGIIDESYPPTLCIERYTKIMRHNIEENREQIFVAEEENRITGFISVCAGEREGFWEIKGFYILPEYQKKGLGKALFSSVIHFAGNKGISEFFLKTLNKAESNGFYKKMGFIPEGFFDLSIGERVYEGVHYTLQISKIYPVKK